MMCDSQPRMCSSHATGNRGSTTTHTDKARLLNLRKNLNKLYRGGTERSTVPTIKIPWCVPWPDYDPAKFTAEKVLTAQWADKEITNQNKAQFQWNTVDGSVNRVSYEGQYTVNEDGYPLNPVGRTGLIGRGWLGKWGPNHAVDILVTRLRRGIEENSCHNSCEDTEKKYQFIAIQRQDTGQWALPGGMVDAGEDVTVALKREFMEEVLDSENMSSEDSAKLNQTLRFMFDEATTGSKRVIYQGYVDDPRNTDHAWMETYAIHIQCSPTMEDFLRDENLKAGSDARSVAWRDIEASLDLYANHKQFIDNFLQTLH